MILPFKLKKISSAEETQKFIDGFVMAYSSKKLKNKHSLKIETLLEYDYVLGLYRKDKMIAGFIVNHYPQRCFEDLTPEQRTNIIAPLNNQVSEVVAIWKDRSLSRYLLWLYVTYGTLAYGRKYIFGCAYKGHGMNKNYQLLSPAVVKSGQMADDLEVFYYTRMQFLGSFVFGAVNSIFTPFKNVYRFAKQFFSSSEEKVIE